MDKKKNLLPLQKQVCFLDCRIKHFVNLAIARKYAAIKHLPAIRRFSKQDLEKLCNPHVVSNKEPKHQTHNYIYTRVSSKKQLDDLSRQIEYIQTRRPEYNSYTLVSDVTSGINFKRKGLQTILDSCLHGIIGEVVIAHRDRLCRFGFDLVKIIIEKSGGKITVLDDEKNKSSEQELAEDLLSIVHIYTVHKWEKEAISPNKLKALKIKMKPTIAQRMILDEWINTSNYVYNKTLECINAGDAIDHFKLRNKLVTENTKMNNPEYKDFLSKLDMLNKEKRDLLKNLVNILNLAHNTMQSTSKLKYRIN